MTKHDELLPWPLDLARDAVDEVLVVVSDVEIGPGGPLDDFPQSELLGDLLLRYCEPPFADVPVTAVFNGDTLDLLKTPLDDGSYPLHTDESIALAKVERVLSAHRPLLARLRRFLEHGAAERRLVFVLGNHDMELLFDGVQRRLQAELGHSARVSFPGISYRHGLVHIEHGQQHDPLFAIDAERPFLEYEGETILNLPWGTVALIDVVMPFLSELGQLDRLKPKKAVLEALPEVRDLLIGAYWRYWTRDFWQRYWTGRDPLRRVSWSMLQEVAWRFGTGDPDVSMQDCRRYLHGRRDDPILVLLGHEHEPAWWSNAARRVLRTGCFRNEYALDVEGGEHRLLPKVYAEVFLRAGVPLRSHLVEVEMPPPAEPAVPARLDDVLGRIPRLRAAAEPDPAGHSRAAQEHAEAKDLVPRGVPGFVETLRSVLGRD